LVIRMREWLEHTSAGLPVHRVSDAVDARAGVVFVPEVWGVDDALRGWARRLAEEGFAVAMPDLWWRYGGSPPLATPAEVGAAVARLDDGNALRDVAAAANVLPPGLPRVVMGFCVGGLYARLASAAVPGFVAAVEFYGRIVYPTLTPEKPAQPLDLLPGRACPLLCHFGELDPVAPPNHVDELERRLSGQLAAAQVFRYPQVGHAFMNPSRPGWNEAAAERAWQRTLRFLDEALPA
jgi:carboxymethylenebutenolidase